MARVFISHASQDLGRAQTVHDWLEADGHRIFLDHSPANGLEVGEDWKRRLYDELRQADAVVCIVTESFTRSVWCAAEVGIADCLGRRVLPIKYDDSKRHPLLSAFQYANFLKGEQEARAGLQRVLRRLDAAGRVGWREGSNPYPGLHPLTEETGAVFFGRGQETRDVAGLLRSAPSSAFLTLVAGASGAGKSSLIRAGVIPLLREDPRWLVLPNVVPGNDPVRTLARQLAVTGQHAPGTAATGRDWSVDAVHRALCSGDDGLRRIVEELLTSAGSGAEWALLPLDQAEELYVRGDDSDRGHLLRLLNEAGELLKTVGSIRSEFLDDLLGEPGIADTDVSVYPVKTLSPAMLRVIVEEPARVAGLRVPGELLARIIDDTGPGSALPLLAFTLNQLADGLERGDTLSPTVYDRLGGVHGAMARRADSALGEACSRTGLSDTAVLDKLTKLAAVDTDGRLSGRRLAISEFDTDAARALEVFVEHRLLSSAAEERGEQGQPGGERVIGVAHESLLSAWPPLRSGLETRMEAMRGARSVEEAAKDWDNAGRSASHLWEAERLAAVPAALTGAEANLLTQVAQDFLAACHDLAAARAARRRRNKVVVLSAFSLVTLIAVAAAVVFNTLRLQTEEAEQKAIARGMDAQAEAVAPADARLALQLAIAAHDLRPGTETKSALVSTTVSSGALQLGAPLSLKAPSLSSAFSGNGMKMSVASSDGKVRVWSLERSAAPRLRAVLSQEADADGQTLALTVDGSLLAAGSASDGLQLWRVAGPTPRRMGRVMSNSEAPKAMVFSPDGRTLAVGSAEGTVRLWDVRNPAEPRSLGGAGGPASSAVRILRFSPDGTRLAAGSYDNSVRMWDTAHLAGEPETLTGPSTDADSVVALAFAPSGNRLATGHRYGLARVWDLAPASGPKLLGKPLNAGTRAALQALAFSANGRSLTTYHYDDNVRVWEPGSDSGPRLLGKVATSQTATGAKPALFSDDATTLVTGDRHGTIQLWRIEDWFPSAFPPYSPPRPEETPVVSGFSARQVRATVGGDGRLQLWRVTSKSAPRKAATLPTGLRAAPTALAFSGDGRLLVVGDADGALAWWDVTDPAHPDRAGTGQCPSGMTALWVSAMEVRAVNKAGRLCRVSAAGKTRTRQLPGGTVTTAQLSLDGSLLAMGHDEGTVGLWNLKDPAHPRLLDTDLRMPVEGAQVLSLSSNHRMLAAAGQDGTIRLWAADGTDWTVVDVLSGPTSAVTSLIFASDGRYLAAGTNNGHVHLWNLSDGQRPRALGPPLTGRTASVTSGVFLSTTPMLLTTDEFGLVRGWSLGTLAALTRDSLREACLRVGHGLNETQWRRYASGAPYRQSCP